MLMLLTVQTKIFVNNKYLNINPEDTINTTRRLRSFCISNNLPDCIFKSQGGWYLIKSDGTLKFISRTLNQLTFNETFKAIKKS